MDITSFKIQNYKGIIDTTIELKSGKGSIYTLVGLNESGKTTILEALNDFRHDTDGMHGVVQKQIIRPKKETLVPKSKKSNFNDSIRITATVELCESEIETLLESLERKHDFKVDRDSFPRCFTVERCLTYTNSMHSESKNIWYNFTPHVKHKGKRKFEEVGGKDDSWQKISTIISEEFPRIVYFPTFLFDFPNKILISEHEFAVLSDADKVVNNYFKKMFSEALISVDSSASLKTHVVDRILNTQKESTYEKFFPWWFGSDEKEQVDSTVSKLSQAITQEVFGKWDQVLGTNIGHKQLVIEIVPEADESGNRLVYLILYIKDGTTKYRVSERSLGFRWFFSFLLFTKYFTGNKNGESIFLFDEPAANLHSMAQNKLLDSLEDIVGDKSIIIYTTHSHHMINPLWLENTYIVSNGEPSEENEIVNVEYDDNSADISAQKYKTFVGHYSDRQHYFQPILDKLNIKPLPLEVRKGGVLVEGKSDFYILNWYKKHHSPEIDANFIPVEGAGKASALMSLYLGTAQDFVILLDSDAKGNTERNNYIKKLPIQEDQIVQIGDIVPGKKLIEDLISNDVKKQIRASFDSKKKTKDLILLAFSQDMFGAAEMQVDEETLENLKAVNEYLEGQLGKISNSSS